MSHHTDAQVNAAFARAPEILRQLQEAGLEHPYFELFADASGALVLGGKVTHVQYELASRLVRSVRPSFRHADTVAIVFCCGLVPEENA